ncbi:MAG: hypothetical protein ABI286_01550 [Edaphobacter sp.]
MKTFAPLELPTIPGRDISGIVRAVGKGVSSFKFLIPIDRMVPLAQAAEAHAAAEKGGIGKILLLA